MTRLALRLANLAAVLCLAGCGWLGGREEVVYRHPTLPGQVSLADADATRAALLEQYLDWAGVPYRTGGSTRDGLDCSGFAQLTYLQRFGIALPRDTAAQGRAGDRVPHARLRPGDLLFFDTGAFERHVGIYVGKRQFLHVSSRAGVMLSRLDERYWEPRFRYAVRVGAN
jgi:cell wall-associated NlpC family hydrolase